jgi:sarcosine oxidase subunit alpha
VTGRRVEVGGAGVDRARPIGFRFDDVDREGLAGDTLASALLAAGVDVVASSPILGRPRGIVSAGSEEPSAFVELTEPWFDPIVAATTVELVEGLAARGRPGVGRLPTSPPPERRARHVHRHVETVVVGGGTAGLEAAEAAAARGDRVLVAQDRPWWGPAIPDPEAQARAARLAVADDVTALASTVALGVYDDGYVVLLERRGDGRDRVWHVRAARVVLATGATERPIAFADCDRPGVMLAGAVRVYLERFAVLAGQRAVVFTTNDGAYPLADRIREAGGEVVAIVDVRDDGSGNAPPVSGIEVLRGWAVAAVEGETRVRAVHLVGPGGRRERVEADLVAVSGGWMPSLGLYRAIGGGLRPDERLAAFVPDGSGPPWLEVVGAAAGEGLPASAPFWYTPAEDLTRHVVDLQRDQTVADVLAAVEAGLRSVEHVKRRTYIGTALDQGRTSGHLVAEIVNAALGDPLGAQGPTTARPPTAPAPFTALAGVDRGELLDPVRTTPIHRWHVANGATFEDVGQWKRPRAYPRPGEDLEAAVLRECRAVREAAGVLDASTLGKIEVVGPDAGAFLDRMYTNRMSTLPVGRIRYGLMLGLDGMVVDDGVAMRLAEDRFLVTTTTGGAAAVLDRFEEWLQTEWPHLRVYCTSVTEQWAVVAIGGPLAREVVRAMGTDVDLDASSFPFMTWREGTVAEVPARLCRVSFTGELSYELHVDGRHGAHVWEAAIAAGEPYGLTPYGTEAMHVLRAEKGYIIVGQDTDGTVTPDDLGMGWIVRTDGSDFLGRRSLERPDARRPDRRHLVGLVPVDRSTLVAEGAQLVARGDADGLGGRPAPEPVPMLGHVTSSYRSAVLGHPFALAMLRAGRSRHGEVVDAVAHGRSVPCEVVPPIFWDPEDARRDG